MKKIIVLIVVCFLLGGCSVTYDLTIKGDNIKEDISVTAYSYEQNKYVLYDSLDGRLSSLYNNSITRRYDEKISGDMPGEVPKHGNYTMQSYDYIDGTADKKLKASTNFSFDDYQYSMAAYTCYDLIVVKHSEFRSSLYSSSLAKCFDTYPLLEKVEVNIKVKGEVTESNSDKIENNVYTWVIDKTNYKNKYVKIVFDTDSSANSRNTGTSMNETVIILLFIVLGVAFIAGFVYIWLKFISKRANKL